MSYNVVVTQNKDTENQIKEEHNMRKRDFFRTAAVLALTGAMAMGLAMTSYAAGWQKDDTGWWYGTNDDNTTWYTNGWQWIDGNGDNIAECYYFDENGYILTSAFTPDGYVVNADGAWVSQDRIVQTKVVDASKVSSDTYDVRDYDSQGLSKAALDILLHTREENKKYGEVSSNSLGMVQYANGLRADYSYSKDGRPNLNGVASDNDSTRIFRESIRQTKEDAEALIAKGYNEANGFTVSYNSTLSIEGFWDDRVHMNIIGRGSGLGEATWMSLKWPDRCVNWGTDWGY